MICFRVGVMNISTHLIIEENGRPEAAGPDLLSSPILENVCVIPVP